MLKFLFKIFFWVHFAGFFVLSAKAQKAEITLQKAQHLVDLSDSIYNQNIDSVIPLCKKAIQIVDSVLPFSMDLETNFLIVKSAALNNIGVVYAHYGRLSVALNYYLKSLKIRERVNDKKGKIESYINISSIYKSQADNKMALEYLHRGLMIAESLNDEKATSNILNNIGVIYEQNSATNKTALEYYLKSLAIEKKLKNSIEIGKRENNIAVIYHNLEDYKKAKEYYLKSIESKSQSLNIAGLMNTYHSLAYLEFEQNNYTEAIKLAKESMKLAEDLKLASGIMQAAELLYEIFAAQQKWKEALQMHEIYNEKKDAQIDESNSGEIKKLQMQYEFDKKLASDSIKASIQNKIMDEKFKNEKKERSALILILILIAVFTIFIFNRYKITQKQKIIIEAKEKETQFQKSLLESQKKIIEEKQKGITDSINYAKRIQQAMLPDVKQIMNSFNDSFILFKPKDIVSGDFYFFKPINGLIFIAAADCTGHGVPGAFMSMICSEKLEEALILSNDTSEILSLLNKGIKTSLKQSDHEESTRDGMDIAICAINLKENTLTFAGANRPLWFIKNGENKVEEIKGTKKAIGGTTDYNQFFESHTITTFKGDTFYLCTDGYADIFSSKGKKLTTKKLKQVLIEIQSNSMSEQMQHLNDYAINWEDGAEQTDDILIIGIRT